MNIVIIGDGKVGSTLSSQLQREGHDIVVIDRDSKVIEQMVNSYDVMGICGNGASYDVQIEAGVQDARLFIAATSSVELIPSLVTEPKCPLFAKIKSSTSFSLLLIKPIIQIAYKPSFERTSKG